MDGEAEGKKNITALLWRPWKVPEIWSRKCSSETSASWTQTIGHKICGHKGSLSSVQESTKSRIWPQTSVYETLEFLRWELQCPKWKPQGCGPSLCSSLSHLTLRKIFSKAKPLISLGLRSGAPKLCGFTWFQVQWTQNGISVKTFPPLENQVNLGLYLWALGLFTIPSSY